MHRMLKHRRQLTRALMMPRYVMPLSIKGSFHFTVRLALRITHRSPVCGAQQNCVRCVCHTDTLKDGRSLY